MDYEEILILGETSETENSSNDYVQQLCADCHVGCYRAGEGTGCRSKISEYGATRSVPDGARRRDSAGEERGAGIRLEGRRGPGAWSAWLRNCGKRHERF